MVTVDSDGFDLAQDDRVVRIHWPAPLADPKAVRGELARLARAAPAG
jgi:putative heme iron utilization protein